MTGLQISRWRTAYDELRIGGQFFIYKYTLFKKIYFIYLPFTLYTSIFILGQDDSITNYKKA